MSIVPSTLTCGIISDSPVGPLTLTFSSFGLKRIDFGVINEHEPAGIAFEIVAEELDAYFSGGLTHFSVRVDLDGTAFQKSVWNLLETIPYGETRSYGHIARILGDIRLARAVGNANRSNPIPIIYPCHRVIGANGQLTGYRGGVNRKKVLLQLETCHIQPELFNPQKDTNHANQ